MKKLNVKQKEKGKESVEKIAMSSCEDFIDVDEENEDNKDIEQPLAVEPLAKPIDQPLLKQIKTEKEDETRAKE